MKKNIIGGEYFHPPFIWMTKKKFSIEDYLKSKYPEKYYCFTGGGYYSLIKIIKDLELKDDEEVLLPSYLCSSMLIPFKTNNVCYKFYKIDKKLTIDIDDLNSRINKHTKAILFINYFGFPQKMEIVKYLKKIKKQGLILIEDCVHSFFSDFEIIGNYAFNSFRKFLPLDGSVILSDKKIECKSPCKTNIKYLLLKSLGQFLRRLTVHYQLIDMSNTFLTLFRWADKEYYKKSNVKFCWLNKFLLTKYDINQIADQRRNNYKKMLEQYADITLFNRINKNITPLGFPVLAKNRDVFRKKLISENIFCPVHWELPDEIDMVEFKESYYISRHIITLSISEKLTTSDLEYLKLNMEESYECIS